MSIHIHPFTGKRQSILVPEVTLIESGLASFDGETGETLSFPFSSLSELVEVPKHLVIDLPYRDMMTGNGHGYLLEIVSYLTEELKLPHTQLIRFDYPQWGSPVVGTRVLVVGSTQLPPVLKPSGHAVLRDVLPDVSHHSVTPQKRSLMSPGLHTMFGYANSSVAPLPCVDDWGTGYPVVERRVGQTLTVARLQQKDISLIWGYESVKLPVSLLATMSPAKALTNILQSLFPLTNS